MRLILLVLEAAPDGAWTVIFRAVRGVAEMPLELRLLVERARASTGRPLAASAEEAPCEEREASPLPFAEDGVAVEPRPVQGAARRRLRREREARELVALAISVQQIRRQQRVAKRAQQLRSTLTLVAALRRGWVG